MLSFTERPSWLSLVFAIRGSELPRIRYRLLAVFCLSLAVTFLHERGPLNNPITPQVLSLTGLALGIFLGFRNNTSYDRFWEARKLWGSLVNTSRTMTRQILTLIMESPQDSNQETRAEVTAFQREMVHRLVAYVHAFKHHLRDQDRVDDLAPMISKAEIDSLRSEFNRPVAILQKLGDRFREAYRKNWIHAQHLPVLEQSLTVLTDIQGGCERIKSTPIPLSYTSLIHQIVAIYCIALPFGIVKTVGAFTPIVVSIVAYAFYGLDAIGDEIENPFGTDANDLPLSTLSTMIEVNVRQRLGETDLPPLRKPKGGLLT
jgi:ion channel-forming bestrophin family protein